MKKIAIFASGSGSNAENINQYFELSPDVTIALIVTNNSKAFVIQRAKLMKIPVLLTSRDMLYNSDDLINILQVLKIDLIVLAGFLWLIPSTLINAFPRKIINIHPALLPNYGGKGMYGMHVHEAVVENNEKSSGITIHYVNEEYDDGQIIHQASCDLDANESPASLAEKIHHLEFEHFPHVIERLLLEKN